MKHLKHISILFVAVLALLLLVTPKAEAATVASGTCGTDLTWVLDDEGTLTISGTGAMTNWSSYRNMPWYSYRLSINTVVISDGVTTIGQYAFYSCTGLKTMTIPNSVTSISASAFEGCSGLTSITIPNSVSSIGKSAFSGCTWLTTVTISDGVRSIGASAFYGCKFLTTATIPNSVTSIGASAFGGCSALESITIPFVGESRKTLSDLYQYPLGYIFGTSSYTGSNAVTQSYIGSSTSSLTSTKYYIPTSLKSVNITDGEVLYGSFYNCSGLTTVTLGDSVTKIGNLAFYNCTGLTSIMLPNGIISIGTKAFQKCTGLTGVYVNNMKAWCEIDFDGVYANPLYYAKKLYLNDTLVSGDLTVPKGTKSVGSYAFYDCTELTSITIPDSVTSIGDSAFYNCTGLTAAVIGDGVTSIGTKAFYNCTGLTTMTIGDGVTSIEESMLSGCSSLKSLTIPFVGECRKTASDIHQYPLGYIFGTSSYTGSSAITQYYYNSSTTSAASSQYYIPSTLKCVTVTGGNILYGAFYNCTGLTSITIGGGVTGIINGAFRNCTGLTSITICDGVTSISSEAFKGISSLISISIPDSVKSIGRSAFDDCSRLTTVTIPDSVTSIGDSAFFGCTGLTKVILGNGVTSIGYNAFYNCTGLTSITIPDSVTSIGYSAFYNCTGLTGVYISNLKNWCKINFGNAEANPLNCAKKLYVNDTLVTELVFPESVKSIGNYAFYRCIDLTSITIPYSVSSIGDSAFHVCTGLTTVTIHYGVRSIGNSAFYDCFKLTTVTIPESVNSIGKGAFGGCSALQSITVPFVTRSFGYIFGTSSYYKSSAVEQSETYYIPVTLRNVTVTGGNIAGSAFMNCTGLTTVTLGDGVTGIGSGAFRNCTGLTTITIGNGVNSIGDHAFYGCTGLTGVYIKDIRAWCEIDFADASYNVTANPLNYAGKLYLNNILICGDLIIPEGTERLGESVFYGCTDITTITIPGSVTSIGSKAFQDCTGLTSVTVGDGVTDIGDFMFSNCTGLASITIPNSVTGIGEWAFNNCTGLTSIIIPNSVTSIGMFAFSNCTGLTSITIPDSVASIGDSALSRCTSLENITIPFVGESRKTRFDTYQYPFGYIFGPSEYSGGSAVQQYYYGSSTSSTTLNTYCIPTTLKNVTITGGEILYGAFYNCTNLSTVTISDRVTRIGDYGFYNCTNLSTVTIGNGVGVIGVAAFRDCTGLTAVTIGEGVEIIGNYAFDNCTGLLEIHFNAVKMKDLSSINNVFCFAGKGGTGIKVTIGARTTRIPAYLFCPHSESDALRPKVTMVEFEEGSVCDSLGDYAFQFCAYLTSITIPDSVTSIGWRAFWKCTSLAKVTLGDGVTNIGEYAFCSCTALTDILFDGSAPLIESWSFSGVTATAYYSSNDPSWTEHVRQNYGGTITWVPYDGVIDVGGTEYMSFADALVACGEGQYLKLNSNTLANAVLSKDLYIDLNGFDLSGTLVTNGYKVYGMDSTTNAYTCENRGVFSCVDENGTAIVPVTHFKSDITGSVKRYMAIKDGNGYSFHRFYLGITHINLRPSTAGVGFKALFCGDEMVISMLDASEAFGYSLGLEGYGAATAYKGRDSFVSGRHVTLRIDNYDIEDFGETALNAKAMLKLSDGTVIESAAVTMTFRQLLESLDRDTSVLTDQQLQAVVELISKYAIVKTWNLNNLLG